VEIRLTSGTGRAARAPIRRRGHQWLDALEIGSGHDRSGNWSSDSFATVDPRSFACSGQGNWCQRRKPSLTRIRRAIGIPTDLSRTRKRRTLLTGCGLLVRVGLVEDFSTCPTQRLRTGLLRGSGSRCSIRILGWAENSLNDWRNCPTMATAISRQASSACQRPPSGTVRYVPEAR
jgi:hypothetical protein